MLIKDAHFIRGAAGWEGLSTDRIPEVAFIGRSNVGKSSLINLLVGRKMLARTSGTPGKTQEFNYYLINDRLYFVDLPGLGYARVSKAQRAKWDQFIRRYMSEHEALRLVVHLIDSRHDPTRLDEEIMAFMKGGWMPYLIVLTKIDKVPKTKRAGAVKNAKKSLARYGLEVPVVMSSASERIGMDEILQWIEDIAMV